MSSLSGGATDKLGNRYEEDRSEPVGAARVVSVAVETLLDYGVGEGQVSDGQIDLFGVETSPTVKPARQARALRVLIVVKAAVNPSSTYGETVCVAGLSAEPSHPDGVRLCLINFRDFEDTSRFKKYDPSEHARLLAHGSSTFSATESGVGPIRFRYRLLTDAVDSGLGDIPPDRARRA